VYSLTSGFTASPVLAEGADEKEGEARDEFADTSTPTGAFCDKLGPIGTVKEVVKLVKTSTTTKTYNVGCICLGSNDDIQPLCLLALGKASARHPSMSMLSATGL